MVKLFLLGTRFSRWLNKHRNRLFKGETIFSLVPAVFKFSYRDFQLLDHLKGAVELQVNLEITLLIESLMDTVINFYPVFSWK